MMTDDDNRPPIEIAVFWDYQNTPLPREVKPAEAAKSIQAAAESLPSVAGRRCRISMRRVYYDTDKFRGVPADPSGLDSSGFDLVHTPTRNMKETVDKKLIVDLLTFAWEVSERGGQPCVVLITSDGDYAYTLSKLNDRGVMNAVFYGKDKNTAGILKDIAMDSLSFEKDVLGSGVAAPMASLSTQTTTSMSAATSAQNIPKSRNQSSNDKLQSSNDKLQQRDTEMQSTSPCGYVFLSHLPKGVEAKEVFSFLTGTYGIDVRHVSIEILQKDPRTRLAHVQCSAKHADYLIALSAQNKLLYKEEAVSAIDDSKPPTSDQLRELKSHLVYKGEASSESGSKRRHLSPKKSSSSIGEADRNILALCVCLAIKQKTWSQRSMGVTVDPENCWVPSGIVISAYKQPGGGVSDEFSTIRDDAIELDFVETARHKLRNKDSYVPIKLDVPTTNLSGDYYLRLTSAGQKCVAEIQDVEVQSLCSALYQKQEDWVNRFGLKFERSWIALGVFDGAYEPTYPLAEDKGVAAQQRETRDIAIASRYIEMSRTVIEGKNEFVPKSSWRSYETGALSEDLYFQLTASGKDLVESTSTAGANNRRAEQRDKRQKTSDALLFGLNAKR